MKGIHIVDNVNNMDDKGGRGTGGVGSDAEGGRPSDEVRRVSMSDARAKLTELVNSAHYSGKPTVIVVNQHDKACVVSHETLKVAMALEELGVDLQKFADLTNDLEAFRTALIEALKRPKDGAR